MQGESFSHEDRSDGGSNPAAASDAGQCVPTKSAAADRRVQSGTACPLCRHRHRAKHARTANAIAASLTVY
jgi:hypothetical protein